MTAAPERSAGRSARRAAPVGPVGPAGPVGPVADPDVEVGVGAVVELLVGGPAAGGTCVARLAGQVVFVRHGLPGERVRARVTERRARFLRADVVQVLAAAADRVAAPCPYARPGGCGGCDLQHVALPAARAWKAAVLADQLRRIGGVDLESSAVTVEPVPGDADGLGWRRRVRFAVDPASGRLGLHAHRSADVVPLDRCLIAHPDLPGVLAHRWPGAAEVVAATTGTGERLVAVDALRGAPPRLPDTSVVVAGDRVRGRGHLTERVAGRAFRVGAGRFWQVHPGAPAVLLDAVTAALRPRSGQHLLDLYAGVGLFAVPLGLAVGAAGSVVAVEADRQAVADARRNAHDLPQVRIRPGRVGDVLAGVTGPVDGIVLDPPRVGAGAAVVRAVARLAPAAVAYVACDGAALARDVATFRAAGYALSGLRAFDIFPMTHHVEAVAALTPVAKR